MKIKLYYGVAITERDSNGTASRVKLSKHFKSKRAAKKWVVNDTVAMSRIGQGPAQEISFTLFEVYKIEQKPAPRRGFWPKLFSGN